MNLTELHQMQADALTPESRFQTLVVRLAKGHGWTHIYHTKTSIGSTAGYPDLHLIHPAGLSLFLELKTQKGKPTADQTSWLDALTAAGQRAYIARPIDYYNGTLDTLFIPANHGIWPGAHA